jgi:uncharacterized LabA/DUF88 family protein
MTAKARCSLYVDVGYLLGSVASQVTGTSLRSGIHVDYEPLIAALIEQAEKIADLPLLRTHWYDAARDGVPNTQQQRIGALPKVKLRLGRFSMDGQQKGVDLRIGLDLVTHARNGAADVFILVSGDDDLTEAVEEAQGHGVQVYLLAVTNADDRPHGMSQHLLRAADGIESVPLAVIASTVTKASALSIAPPAVAPPPVVTPTAATPAALPSTNSRAVPTPKDLASLSRPSVPRVSSPVPAPPRTPSVLAYSSATGYGTQSAPYADPGELADQIDQVVGNVVAALKTSTTTEALAELKASKPSIPREIDKALLADLSNLRDEFDLSDRVRHQLRAHFWTKVDQLL